MDVLLLCLNGFATLSSKGNWKTHVRGLTMSLKISKFLPPHSEPKQAAILVFFFSFPFYVLFSVFPALLLFWLFYFCSIWCCYYWFFWFSGFVWFLGVVVDASSFFPHWFDERKCCYYRILFSFNLVDDVSCGLQVPLPLRLGLLILLDLGILYLMYGTCFECLRLLQWWHCLHYLHQSVCFTWPSVHNCVAQGIDVPRYIWSNILIILVSFYLNKPSLFLFHFILVLLDLQFYF